MIDLPDDMAEAFWLADTRTDGELGAYPRLALRSSSPRWSRDIRAAVRKDATVAVIPSVARPTGGAWYEGSDLRALAEAAGIDRGLFLRAERRRASRADAWDVSRRSARHGNIARHPAAGASRSWQPRAVIAAVAALRRSWHRQRSRSTIMGICARRASTGSARRWRNRGEETNLDFKHKVVAITGAAGGIGQALCAHFGSLGASIAALDKNDAVKTLPDKLAADNIRASRRRRRHRRSGTGARRFSPSSPPRSGRSTSSSTTPASPSIRTLELTSPASWRGDIEGNLNGAYYCAHAVLPAMKERRAGAILNVGSVNGLYALGDPAYSAAKAGMITLTKSLAMEYGRYGIRANIVLPGTVRTPLWDERASRNPKVLEELVRWYPLGRIVEPLDVAQGRGFPLPPTRPRRSPAPRCRSIAGSPPAISSWRAN